MLLGAARELVHTQVQNQHRAEMVQFLLEPVFVAETLHLALATAAAVVHQDISEELATPPRPCGGGPLGA